MQPPVGTINQVYKFIDSSDLTPAACQAKIGDIAESWRPQLVEEPDFVEPSSRGVAAGFTCEASSNPGQSRIVFTFVISSLPSECTSAVPTIPGTGTIVINFDSLNAGTGIVNRGKYQHDSFPGEAVSASFAITE